MRISQAWAVAGLLCVCACAARVDGESASASPATPEVSATRQDLLTSETDRAVLRAHLRTSLARTRDSMAMEERPDGLKIVRHRGGFQHATLVVRDDDGARTQRCTDDGASAERALMGAP